MPKLTKQAEKVYRFILANRGCTTKEIMLGTGIQCPSGRISEMRADGVKIISIGQKKYPGSKSFEMYAIEEPLTKQVSHISVIDGRAVETFETVAI